MQRWDPERSRLILGINSGTSADSVDLALIRVEGAGAQREVERLHSASARFPSDLKAAIHSAPHWSLADLARFHQGLGVFFGRCAREFMAAIQLAPGTLTCIGSHGQTVFHHSGDPTLGSLQLGCLSALAETAGVDVVGDFRQADLARGGQGAPISPFADWVLHGNAGRERVILNLGGIANITLLPPRGAPLAWDSGPANGPLDALMRLERGEEFDLHGELARQGRVHEPLLRELQEDPYFGKLAPKSTGLEHFGLALAKRIRADYAQLPLEDILATLCETVAWAAASSLRIAGWKGGSVYLCGGGVHNRALCEALDRHLGASRVETYESLGWNPDFREAVAFALLADAFLLGESSTWPSTTGARSSSVLGVWRPSGFP